MVIKYEKETDQVVIIDYVDEVSYFVEFEICAQQLRELLEEPKQQNND